MEEEKVLLQVALEGEATSVFCHCADARQKFQVALAIFNILADSPGIATMFSSIIEMSHDPEFQKALDAATVQVPDFNAILKQ